MFQTPARYANWPSDQAQTLVNVGSNPTRAIIHAKGSRDHASAGHWRAPVAVTHPPIWALAVQLRPDAIRHFMARSAIGRLPGSQPGEEGSTPSRAALLARNSNDRVAELVDARASGARAFKAWEFDSPLGHLSVFTDLTQAGRRSVGPHEADFPVRFRGLGLRAGRCSAEFHMLGRCGSTPMPVTSADSRRPGRQTGKAASMRCWCVWVRLPSRPFG